MKIKLITLATLLAAATLPLSLTGCGGGGSDTPVASSVSGIASKGPLISSSVCAYAIGNDGSKGALLGTCATTDAHGNYSIDLGNYSGPVLFEATGGSYVDEATGATVPLASPLHSVLASVSGGAVTAAITPLTELAYQMANAAAGALSSANIRAALATVQANFGVADIIGTQPVDPLNLPAGASAAQKSYALALAMLSQYQHGLPAGTTLAAALQNLQGCLSAPATACGNAPATVGATLGTAMSDFMTGHPGYAGITLPVANFGSNSGNQGGGGGGGGGVNGPVVVAAQVASLCPGARTTIPVGITQYSGCDGRNITQGNAAVLNTLNSWFSAHGTGMTVYNSNYNGVAVGSSCSFAIEPGLGLWMLTVNNASVALTPGSFDGSAHSLIQVNAAGEIVYMALGDFTSATGGREINFLNGRLDVVYQSMSGNNMTTLFCGNAN